MERSLLFDSGCAACTKLARAIEHDTEGWLAARSLHEPEIQALLDRARPGWRWEPTLLEVDGDQVRAFTGLALRARLVAGLGPRRAWRVARLVRQVGMPLGGVDLGRRSLLQRGGALLAGLALFGPRPSLLQQGPQGEGIGKKIRIHELTPEELNRVLQRAIGDKDVQIIKEVLEGKGYKFQQPDTQAGWRIEFDEARSATFLQLSFTADEKSEKALLFFAAAGVKTGVGAVILHTATRDPLIIDMYDVQGGIVVYRVLEKYDNGTIIDLTTGRTYLVPGSPALPASPTTCAICNAVCGFIRGAGCGLSGGVLCALACAPLGEICFPICFALYALICLWGLVDDCQTLCTSIGYCP